MAATYTEPGTLDEALATLADRPSAHCIAGGTDLVVAARSGKAPLPDDLIGIHRLTELSEINEAADGLRIGAIVNHAALEASEVVRRSYPALADACAMIGSPATRYVGTLGGNLCNGSPAADTAGPLIVHGAEAQLRSTAGARSLPVEDVFVGPGRAALETGELLTEVFIPAAPIPSGSAYVRLEYRRAMEIAVVGAAAFVALESGEMIQARIVLAAVGPTPVRASAVEERLIGRRPDATALAEAADVANEATSPIDDIRGSAEYRQAMVPVITRRALEQAVARANGASR